MLSSRAQILRTRARSRDYRLACTVALSGLP